MTHENILEIVKELKADSVLVDMLAKNPPYYAPTKSQAKVNSIIPMEFMENIKNAPAIGLKAGVNQRVGVNLRDAIILIRCYNNMDKTYVDINKVLSRIEFLLHRKLFSLTGMVHIATDFQSLSLESVDDAYQLRFREASFKLQII